MQSSRTSKGFLKEKGETEPTVKAGHSSIRQPESLLLNQKGKGNKQVTATTTPLFTCVDTLPKGPIS